MLTERPLLKIAILMLFALAIVACGGEMDHSGMDHGEMGEGEMEMSGDYADLDISLSKMSDDGKFHVSLENEAEMLMINELQSWILTVQGSDMATAIEDATVTIGGGMPEHQHGFPTEPEVTGHIGDGKYQVEGVKYQMGGWWEMSFEIEAGGESDSVTFNVIVPQ